MHLTDRRCHSLHCEEGGEVGGVGADDDESEEPPHPAHDARGRGLGVQVGAARFSNIMFCRFFTTAVLFRIYVDGPFVSS